MSFDGSKPDVIAAEVIVKHVFCNLKCLVMRSLLRKWHTLRCQNRAYLPNPQAPKRSTGRCASLILPDHFTEPKVVLKDVEGAALATSAVEAEAGSVMFSIPDSHWLDIRKVDQSPVGKASEGEYESNLQMLKGEFVNIAKLVICIILF